MFSFISIIDKNLPVFMSYKILLRALIFLVTDGTFGMKEMTRIMFPVTKIQANFLF